MISEDIKLIIDEIKGDECYQKYMKYRHLIEENKEINDNVLRLKELAKKCVNAKEFDLLNAYENAKKEYDNLYKELSNNALVMLFLEQEEQMEEKFNQIFGKISEELRNYIYS